LETDKNAGKGILDVSELYLPRLLKWDNNKKGCVSFIATKPKVLRHIKTSKEPVTIAENANEPVTIAEMPMKINSLSMSCTCFGSLAKIKAKRVCLTYCHKTQSAMPCKNMERAFHYC